MKRRRSGSALTDYGWVHKRVLPWVGERVVKAHGLRRRQMRVQRSVGTYSSYLELMPSWGVVRHPTVLLARVRVSDHDAPGWRLPVAVFSWDLRYSSGIEDELVAVRDHLVSVDLAEVDRRLGELVRGRRLEHRAEWEGVVSGVLDLLTPG